MTTTPPPIIPAVVLIEQSQKEMSSNFKKIVSKIALNEGAIAWIFTSLNSQQLFLLQRRAQFNYVEKFFHMEMSMYSNYLGPFRWNRIFS